MIDPRNFDWDGPHTIGEECEIVSVWIKETRGIDLTPEQIFHASPTGELIHVFAYFCEARRYYTGQEMNIDGLGNITWT